MFKVYWTETVLAHSAEQIAAWLNMTGEELDSTATVDVVRGKTFLQTELSQAVQYCESLRQRRRTGERLSFITMQGEDPNSVGEQGVSDKLPEGYDWTKQDRAGKSRRR